MHRLPGQCSSQGQSIQAANIFAQVKQTIAAQREALDQTGGTGAEQRTEGGLHHADLLLAQVRLNKLSAAQTVPSLVSILSLTGLQAQCCSALPRLHTEDFVHTSVMHPFAAHLLSCLRCRGSETVLPINAAGYCG